MRSIVILIAVILVSSQGRSQPIVEDFKKLKVGHEIPKNFPYSIVERFQYYTYPDVPLILSQGPTPVGEGHFIVAYTREKTEEVAYKIGQIKAPFIRRYTIDYLDKMGLHHVLQVYTDDDPPMEVRALPGGIIKTSHQLTYRDNSTTQMRTDKVVGYYGIVSNSTADIITSSVRNRLEDFTEAELDVRVKAIHGVDHILTADDREALAAIQRAMPGIHGYRMKELHPRFLDVVTANSPANGYEKGFFIQEFTTPGSYSGAIFPTKLDSGMLLGMGRRESDNNNHNVSVSYLWTKDGKVGRPAIINYYGFNFPTVTVIHDRFVKLEWQTMAKYDGQKLIAPEKKSHAYLVLSENDLFTFDEVPEGEAPIFRNYIFARYGYKFKNPAYQSYFSKFSWYKPTLDDVSNLLTADEREMVNQLLKREKPLVGK